MLKQRVITATVLLALLLPTLVLRTAWPFVALALIGFTLGGWEWARLNGAESSAPVFGALLAAACAVAFWAGWTDAAPPLAWWVAMGAWVLGGSWALRAGPAGWPDTPRAARLGLGIVVLWAAWLAMANAKAIGLNFILSVFMLVWTADICAYFGGRAFGRRKLALKISPGKSWEGVWSGVVGAIVVALVWWGFIDRRFAVDSASVYTRIEERLGIAGLGLAVVFLVAMSVVGDLVESLVKRSAGAKDSSGLLPGHGGVLDRLDALLPVFPIALALAFA